MKYVHVIVTGKVQGVRFRAYVVDCVLQCRDVTGFVHNKEYGGVEIVLEGEREYLEQLVQQIKQGPPASRVDSLKIEWRDITKRSYDNFSRN